MSVVDQYNQTHPYTVLIEGNLGSGKSTLLKYFERFEQIKVMPEPVEDWENLCGANLLELFYNDQEHWGMAFQSYVMLTSLKSHLAPLYNGYKVKVIERSLFSRRYCFMENMIAGGALEQETYNVLNTWHGFICETFPIRVDLVIYLRTTPQEVYRRMQERGREEDTKVTLEYLEGLHALRWLINGAFPRPWPVHVIDANNPLEDLHFEYNQCIKQMLETVNGGS